MVIQNIMFLAKELEKNITEDEKTIKYFKIFI